jgi:arginine/lysine/ornithine decarboxylase
MPGHKGKSFLGFEKYDITEIKGADSLFEASGIIKESEENASGLFGCHTFYSAEGSSLAIRAMLYLAVSGESDPLVLAGRNAHKTFLTASALLGFDIEWLYPQNNNSYLTCPLSAKDVERGILVAYKKPAAVYLTSPDYLGNMLPIEEISLVCQKHGVLLLVDNAHGAYLRFLSSSLHPIDLGADMCCDSAHKTLPCVTGGAYLHVSSKTDSYFKDNAKEALSLFASTSPSYLIMQSLDMTNKYLSENYGEKLSECVLKLYALKNALAKNGYTVLENEPLKLTINTKKYGYTGYDFGKLLENENIFPEFYDNDFLVLMFTPEIKDFEKIEKAFLSIPKRDEIAVDFPIFQKPEKIMSVRKAMLSKKETVLVGDALGKILASPSVGCPPAVPIAVCGEVIDGGVVRAFKYYGIEECVVVK